jgi:hypothetical protein
VARFQIKVVDVVHTINEAFEIAGVYGVTRDDMVQLLRDPEVNRQDLVLVITSRPNANATVPFEAEEWDEFVEAVRKGAAKYA